MVKCENEYTLWKDPLDTNHIEESSSKELNFDFIIDKKTADYFKPPGTWFARLREDLDQDLDCYCVTMRKYHAKEKAVEVIRGA